MDKPVLPATLREMFDATTLRLASDNAVIMNGDEPEDYTTTLYNAEEVLLAMRTYFQD